MEVNVAGLSVLVGHPNNRETLFMFVCMFMEASISDNKYVNIYLNIKNTFLKSDLTLWDILPES